jgi:hypothetical protein
LIETEIRSLVDLAGYLHAVKYDVDIISAINSETGFGIIFGINIPVLTDRRKDGNGLYPPFGTLPAELLQTVMNELAAQIVLQEFREAMGFPIGTGFHCYRAIEAMMQSIKTSDTEKEVTAWGRLRQHLCLARTTIDFVKGHADLPRHGRPSGISHEDRTKLFKVTDEIVRRYLHYLSQGKIPLPVSHSYRQSLVDRGDNSLPDGALAREVQIVARNARRNAGGSGRMARAGPQGQRRAAQSRSAPSP